MVGFSRFKKFFVLIILAPLALSVSASADYSYSIEARQGVPIAHQIKFFGEYMTGITRTVSVESGTLPNGVFLSSAGIITGTPSDAGALDVSLRVRENGVPKDIINLHVVIAPAEDNWLRRGYFREGPYVGLVTQETVTMPFAQATISFGTTNGTAIIIYPNLTGAEFRTLGTFVLMPGRDLAKENYVSLARWIASWGFIVVVPDHLNPNHSESPYRFNCFSVADMRSLSEIINESIRYVTSVWSQSYRADINRVVIGGHSCGAIGARLATKVISKLRGAIFLDTSPPYINQNTMYNGTYGTDSVYRHFNIYREPSARIPVFEYGSSGSFDSFHVDSYGPRDRANYSGPYYGLTSTGPDSTHIGFIDNCTPEPWNACNSSDRREQHLGFLSRFIVPFLKYYLDDDLTSGGDLYSNWTKDVHVEMLTPSYALFHNSFNREMINDEILIDNFAQTSTNETINTSTNFLNQAVTQSAGVSAIESFTNANAPVFVPYGNEFSNPIYRVRDITLQAGQYLSQSLGSNSSPLNASAPNSAFEFEIARIDGLVTYDNPVKVRVSDANGYTSQEITVLDTFLSKVAPLTARIPISAFPSIINPAQLTDLRIVSRASGEQRYNIDNIKITRGACDTDATSLGDMYTHTNPRSDGKILLLSACGMRADNQTVQISLHNTLVGQEVRVFVADKDLSPPVPMWGGLMVPSTTDRFRLISLTATAPNQILTFNIPAANLANTLFVQAVMEDSGLPTGESAISNALRLER